MPLTDQTICAELCLEFVHKYFQPQMASITSMVSIKIHIDRKYAVVVGCIVKLLFAGKRISDESKFPKMNHHILSQLFAGANEEMTKKLHLASPEFFRHFI